MHMHDKQKTADNCLCAQFTRTVSKPHFNLHLYHSQINSRILIVSMLKTFCVFKYSSKRTQSDDSRRSKLLQP